MAARLSKLSCVLLITGAAAVSCAVHAGCASDSPDGFSRFYQPVTLSEHAGSKPMPFAGEPDVLVSADLKRDRIQAYEHGYVVIGSAFFADDGMSVDGAKRQARCVGAAQVLVSSSSPQKDLPPNTTPHRMQSALFLAPMEKKGLGVLLEDLPFDEQLRLGTHVAERIIAVAASSPAREAGLEPGDIILSIDGSQPFAMNIRSAALAESESELVILRGEQRLSKNLAKQWH